MPRATHRVHLTKRYIDATTYHDKGSDAPDVRWDDAVPGLGVRVRPGGKKTFLVRYRDTHGRQHQMALGEYGPLTLDQARSLALQRLGQAVAGDDPLEQRRRERAGETIRDLCAAYLERHASRKRSARDDRRRIEQRILPAWGSRKVASVTRADVAALHREIGKSAPYEANRTLALISKMWGCAEVWGIIEEGQANPAKRIDRFREEKRDRWVTPIELPRLRAAIEVEPNEIVRWAIWLYLLTGVRKSELLQARWTDIDWERRVLRIPETKQGRPHEVPLSRPAVEVLKQLHAQRIEDNPHVLVGRMEGESIVNIDKGWRRIRAAAKLDDVRLHDLRRTVGSWLAQDGHSLIVIGRVLGHSNLTTTQVYARLGEDPCRSAMERLGEQIRPVGNATKDGTEVTQLVSNHSGEVPDAQQRRRA